MSKKTHLVIAGHGTRRNGTFDPGATGYISKGEHRYMKENLFPAMKKYAGDNFIFYSKRNVYSYGDIVALARKYGASSVTEFHYDAASQAARGGHVIIHNDYKPDKIDLAIRDAISSMVGIRYSHKGYKGISGRSNLANVNRTANGKVNYRMVELGFGTNRTDSDIMLKQTDAYAKKLVKAIDGGKVSAKPAPSKPTPSKPAPSKSINTLAKEVIAGKHGNGDKRKKSLGSKYDAVQAEVNRIAGGNKPKPKLKSNNTIAKEVIAGKWGNGSERSRRLKAAGYNPNAIQKIVNKGVGGSSSKKSGKSFSTGTKVKASKLYATSSSTKNVRSTPVTGYIEKVNSGWKNPYRLSKTKGGKDYLGFTKKNYLK